VPHLSPSLPSNKQEEQELRDEEERRRKQAELKAAFSPPPPASAPSSPTQAPTGTEASPNDGKGFADWMRNVPFPEPNITRPFDIESLGLLGNWQELGGNFVLRPPGEEPRGHVC
jgi:hypothetical protein